MNNRRISQIASFALSFIVPTGGAAQAGTFPPVFDLTTLDGTNGFSIVGISAGDFTGSSVSGAGDFNSDGIADLIIGAPGVAKYGPHTGAAYVVYGRSSGFGKSLHLANLTAHTGMRLYGVAGSYTAGPVTSAGDVNGDGVSDLVIGSAGIASAYVVFGRGGLPAEFEPSQVNGKNGFQFSDSTLLTDTGAAVAGAGDINHDGFSDVLIGSPFTDGVYLIFGRSKFRSIFPTRKADLLGGTQPHRFNPYIGSSVAGAGDINGDGFDDWIVGSIIYSTPRARAYVVFGNAAGNFLRTILRNLDGTNGFTLKASHSDPAFQSVASAGDFNGDGFFDVVTSLGVIFGKTSGFPATLYENTLDGTNGFSFAPKSFYSVASAGDVNGDGFPDIIIGAPEVNGAYVVFGKAGGFPATLDLAGLEGTSGFFLKSPPGESTGESIGAADINGDGASDLIIGAPGGARNAGKVYVVFGRP